jgi:protein disulfide-isomerase A1
MMVEFYAPWCGHCKSLAPEYAKAAQTLEKEGSDIMLAKVDATVAKKLASEFDVKGFPTLKFFRSGSPGSYEGGRTADDIVSWVKKRTGPIATSVSSTDELENLKEANEVFAIGVFSDEKSAGAKAFLGAAANYDHITFAISSDAGVKGSLGLEKDTVVVVKTFDDLRNDMAVQSFHTAESLGSFIATHATPLVQTFNDETSADIFKSPIQKHMLFFTDTESSGHADVVSAFKEAAIDVRGQALMINVPASEDRVLEYFGITKKDLPHAVLADMAVEGTMKKFPFEGPYDADSVKAFMQAALQGTLKPHLKSEDPSPSDTTGPVTILRGSTFADIVVDNEKDVLVEFYAPWCGHCKQLAPVYDEVGEAFSEEDGVVIAKMDSTANEIDIPGVSVKGFPTIVFFKGNDKANPVVYEGGRTKADFIKYMKKNASNSLGDVDEDEDDEDDEEDEEDENDEL